MNVPCRRSSVRDDTFILSSLTVDIKLSFNCSNISNFCNTLYSYSNWL